ncbi:MULTISPECIES: hypothetical protein [Serratia]|uniref:hypothetical protein n=1 Tax=Serratia TaxID=613 RepID=UPI00080FA36E|nr:MULTISPECIES: hypothetical protein [Serratia]OCJ37357.1 hypothetical protein A6U95_24925 [Serratia sp. 14-2641]QXN65260.1 hypothetical protein J8M99_26230 [Serratia fonticola]UAN65834.1 hypothetical protein KGP16_26610 [Serratia sp. JSRIV006]
MKNYEGFEALREDIAKVGHMMDELHMALFKLTSTYPVTEDALVIRLAGQSLRRINTLCLEAYREMAALDHCFEE